MTDQPQPDWARQLEAALEQAGQELGNALTRVGHIFTAQGAMGSVITGDFDKARQLIAGLPPEQVDILGMAARALAELADEEGTKRQ